MTISSSTNQVSYTGDGSFTGPYSVPFRFFADTDLMVFVDGTLQTLTTHYTVSGAGDQGGGSITFVTAPANTKTVLFLRNVPATQSTDYLATGAFPAESHENALDRLTTIVAARLGLSTTLAEWDATTKKIVNVTDPTNDQDAATKTWVNTQISGSGTSTVVPNPSGENLKCLQLNADASAALWTGTVLPSTVTADKNKILVTTAADTYAFQTPYVLNRNLLDNGDMKIWQRGRGYNAVDDETAIGTMTADRWRILCPVDHMLDVDRATSVPSTTPRAKYSMRLDVKTGSKPFGICQIIENAVAAELTSQVASLSFWVQSTATSGSPAITTFRAAVRKWAGPADAPTANVVGSWHTSADTNPTLVSSDWTYLNTPANLAVTSSWSQHTIENISIGSSPNNLAVFIWANDVDGITTDRIRITQVQLQLGDKATAFLPKRPAEEWTNCARYWQQSYDQGTSAGTTATSVPPGTVSMRTKGSSSGFTSLDDMRTVLSPAMFKIPVVKWYSFYTGAVDKVRETRTDSDKTVADEQYTSRTSTGLVSLDAAMASGDRVIGQFTASAEVSSDGL